MDFAGEPDDTRIMNTTQKAQIEKTWTPETNMSIPQYVERFEAEMIGYAEADLNRARTDRQRMHLIAETIHGTVVILYRPASERKDITGSRAAKDRRNYIININGASMPMLKKDAVEFLVNSYQIEKA